jgi:methylthioribose-1-phosphate isomerase
MGHVKTLRYDKGVLHLIDQRKLPDKLEIFECRSFKDVEFAIRDMVVRGAPAIGVTAAYGVVIAAAEFLHLPKGEYVDSLKSSIKFIGNSRPTAVNLMWALKRMEQVIDENLDVSNQGIFEALLDKATQIEAEDIKINRKMAKHGNEVVPGGATILTHCNAGALATVDYGTALGVIREAHHSGKNIKVFADETRPRFQGARLTTWELVQEGIPVTLIPDSVAPVLIRDGKIDIILVGADRIALNGDTANKIGTFMLSQMARDFNVPFYVVAPVSTIDFEIEDGSQIVIEERDFREVTHIGEFRIAPQGICVYNPAFDVTPNSNITGIITEAGIITPDFRENILKLKK